MNEQTTLTLTDGTVVDLTGLSPAEQWAAVLCLVTPPGEEEDRDLEWPDNYDGGSATSCLVGWTRRSVSGITDIATEHYFATAVEQVAYFFHLPTSRVQLVYESVADSPLCYSRDASLRFACEQLGVQYERICEEAPKRVITEGENA